MSKLYSVPTRVHVIVELPNGQLYRAIGHLSSLGVGKSRQTDNRFLDLSLIGEVQEMANHELPGYFGPIGENSWNCFSCGAFNDMSLVGCDTCGAARSFVYDALPRGAGDSPNA